MKLYLIFLNVWIAAVYYMIYCEPRSYNSALAGFWGIMAIFWIYDLKVNYTPFDRTHKHTALAVLLCSEYIKIENNDEEVYESYVAGLRVFVEPAGEGAAGYS